jgi:diguanylate cyclase (GGDEF)-like protein
MSLQEKDHLEYWKKILQLAKDGMIPQVFDNPVQINNELKALQTKVDRVIAQNRPLKHVSLNHAFILTYRLEFYVLHRAFSTLFHFLKTFSTEKTPEDHYDYHINQIIDYISKYSELTPELELLGDTINILWEEHKNIAVQDVSDFLTDVLNRRGLFNAIKPLSYLAKRNNTNVGILLIDIDEFKKVNDTYGHQKGDAVLKTVANIIKSQIRGSDVIGRYGGDEFMVFLSSVKRDYLYKIAEKIRTSVEKKTVSGIPVTISIGAVQSIIKTDPDVEMSTLINKADKFMYQAKSVGKNRVCVYDS